MTTYQIPNPFIPLLLSLQTHQVCPETKIIAINAYNTIADLQQILQLHSIHSVPVLENGSCVGMVDGLHLANFFFTDPINYTTRAKSTTVLSLLIQTTTIPLPVFSTTNLLDVISIVAPGIHRAIVLKSESNHSLFSVCSESDIIATIHSYIIASQPLKQTNLPVYMLSHLPLCAFSNYFANIKFSINASESIQRGLEAVQQALILTTTQGTAASSGKSNSNSPQQSSPPPPPPVVMTQIMDTITTPIIITPTTTPPTSTNSTPTPIDTTIGHNSSTDLDQIDPPTRLTPLKNPSRYTSAILEWNAPIIVVIDGDRIIGSLNADTFHRNIVGSYSPEVMCGNLSKSVNDFLTAITESPPQQQHDPNSPSIPPHFLATTLNTDTATTTAAAASHNIAAVTGTTPITTAVPTTTTTTTTTTAQTTTIPASPTTSFAKALSFRRQLDIINPTSKPNPLGPVGLVVPETIHFGKLLELFTINKLDYVWVSSCIVGDDAKWVEAIPLSWFENDALGIVTINDLLRLISRDNITLYPELLPDELV